MAKENVILYKALLSTCVWLVDWHHPRIAWEASKKIQKTHKSKILCSGWMQDLEKWFGRWDARHLLHDASLDSSVNDVFLQRQCIITWEKCGGSRFTNYTINVAPNYKTIFFAKRGSRTHRYMLEPIPPFEPLLSCDLARMHWDVRRDVGAQVMRVADYAQFALNKFESQSITLWYNAPPLTIFDHAFHISLEPNPCTNFSHNHNVHSQLQHSLLVSS